MTNSNRSLAIQRTGSITSRDGYPFEPTASHWKLSRDTTISLQWVSGELSCVIAESLIKVLTHYAILYSADHTYNLATRFRAFSRWRYALKGMTDQIDSSDLISYRSTLDAQHEFYLGVLSGLFKAWIGLGLPGVDADVPSLFEGWRLKGNVKGLAVQTKCPDKGALTDLEYQGLQERLLEGFERDEIDLADYMLATLFCATGRRPAQLADLKGGDLVEARSSDGLREFVLNVPRRKVRGGVWRAEFKAVALTPEIGMAVRVLIAENEVKLRTLCSDVRGEVLKRLPLFPAWKVIKDAVLNEGDALSELMATDAAHLTTPVMRLRLERTVAALSVISERTDGPIRVFPTRLRRTLATRAAREGYGPLIIAELLDHTDDQNARVYTENVPEHVDAINEAMARQLAPLAQAFAGVLVRSEREALRGDDPTSRVRTDSGSAAGTCGHFGFCGALAPIACYTCRHFQPWIDGPHEDVLHGLLAERDRIRQLTRDMAIAAINDRTIFAVTQVIQMCAARRSEVSAGELDG